MKNFDFAIIDKEVSAQYNDYKGLIALDTHDGCGLFSMCKDFGIDTDKYFVYGATCYDSEPIGNNSDGLRIKFLLIEKKIYGDTYDKISKYSQTIQLTEQSISVPYNQLGKYLKRISIGVVSNISGIIKTQLPNEYK